MKIEVKRIDKLPLCTIGEMYIDGKLQCYTLEDTVREQEGMPVKEWKIPNKTAIPCGEYELIMSMSNRFKKVMPELKKVEGFAGVRIHAGNTQEDTEGCILVGRRRAVTKILESRLAVNALYPLIQAAVDRKEKVTITIS